MKSFIVKIAEWGFVDFRIERFLTLKVYEIKKLVEFGFVNFQFVYGSLQDFYYQFVTWKKKLNLFLTV